MIYQERIDLKLVKALHKIPFLKYEPWLFCALLIANLVPIFTDGFFPTIDGPAHLYNAQLIRELLLSDDPMLHKHFMFTPGIMPNWSGHGILVIFSSIFPGRIAEFLFLCVYLLGLPLSFRFLVKQAEPKNLTLSYLIFPLCFSFLFLLGFYNFSLGLMFLFWSAGLWLKIRQSDGAKKILWVFLFFSVLLTYLSHVFVFFFLFVFLGGDFLISLLLSRWESAKNKELGWSRKLGVLMATTVIPGGLFIHYSFNSAHLDEGVFLQTNELIDWLTMMRHLVVFNFQLELPHVRWIKWPMIFLTVISLIWLAIQSYRTKARKTIYSSILRPIPWLLVVLSALILYFTLPDSNYTAGFVSVRLCLFVWLGVMSWLVYQKTHWMVHVLFMAPLLIGHFRLNNYYRDSTQVLVPKTNEIYEVATLIPEGSVVLPLNFTGEWQQAHFVNYLGADRPLILLDNYETDMGYFPLKWNDAKVPNNLLGTLSSTELTDLHWRNNPANETHLIPYVFVLGEFDKSKEDHRLISDAIDQSYELIQSEEGIKLFGHRSLY